LVISDVKAGSPKRVAAAAGEGADLFSQIHAALSSMKPSRDLAHCLIMEPAEQFGLADSPRTHENLLSTVIAEVASQPFSISISMAFTAMG
jgi:hypothetical protein